MDQTDIRSLLFVPGDNERRIGKAIDSQADAVIVDLEDSVVPDNKARARIATGEILRHHKVDGKPLVVRLNAFESGLTALDVAAVMAGQPWAVMLPKCRGNTDLARLADFLEVMEVREGITPGTTRIITVATETAAATLTLSQSIPSMTPRLWGLLWGGEDLAASLGAQRNRDEAGNYTFPYQFARSQCLFAANALGVQAIDAVYTAMNDPRGLEQEVEAALRDGFVAKAAIHPSQVEIINRVLMATSAQVDWSSRVLELLKDSAVARLDGGFVDLAHKRIAERLLLRAKRHGTR